MHAERESDGCVVLAKSANNGEQCFSAESMEGRQPAKRNIEQAPWTGLRTGLLGHEDCSMQIDVLHHYVNDSPSLDLLCIRKRHD